MNKSVSLKLALRLLFFRKASTFSSQVSLLAILGLGLGVCSLLLTSSIINGFYDTISNKLSSFEGNGRLGHILGNNLSINDPMIDSLISNYPESITPYTNGMALLRTGSNAEGVLVEGSKTPPRVISKTKLINDGMAIIGKGIASSMNIQKGDTIYMQGLSANISFSNIPVIKPFIVSEIFYSGLKEYDNTIVYISLNDSRSLLGLKYDQISGLIYRDKRFLPENDVKYPFYFETWKQKHVLLFEWISLQRLPAYLMFSLIAVVGLVNLIAAIAMIIIEKTSQIGILLAQGASNKVIKAIFIIQGSVIGLCGGFIGGFLALLLILIQNKYEILKIPSDVYLMDKIPVSFDYITFLIILLTSFSSSIIASWFPVKKIAGLNIAESLKYE